jgi:hypothetical protein
LTRLKEASRPAPLEPLMRPIWFACALLVLSATISFVYADRNMPVQDEGSVLAAAAKILHGGVFYRDVDAYTFPGVSYLLAGAMSLFGEHLSVARTLAGSFFCAMVLGVYACALALMDRKRAALCALSVLSLKFLAYPIYTMYFWVDPSLAAALFALALFLRHPFTGASSRLLAIGVLTGLSIVTKQSTGICVAAVFAIVLAFPAFAHGPRRRPARLPELAAYAAGLFLVLASMSIYFASEGLFEEMIRGGLFRPFTGYLSTSAISFLPPLEWWNFGELDLHGPIYFSQLSVELVLNTTPPVQSIRDFYLGLGEFASRALYSVIPIAFAACAWLWLRAFRVSAPDEHDEHDDEESALARARFFSAAGVALAITVSAFPRADFIHVISIYPAVALIGFALCRPSLLGVGWAHAEQSRSRGQGRRMHFEAAFVALLLVTTTFLTLRHDATLSHRLSIERADLWVRPRDAWLERLIPFIRAQVPEGESLFVYGHEAHWYFLSDRYTPRGFSQIYPGMTGDETGQKLATLIRETRPRIIVQGVLTWPGMPPVPGYTRAFRRTLYRLYKLDPEAIDDPPDARILRVWRLRD